MLRQFKATNVSLDEPQTRSNPVDLQFGAVPAWFEHRLSPASRTRDDERDILDLLRVIFCFEKKIVASDRSKHWLAALGSPRPPSAWPARRDNRNEGESILRGTIAYP